MTSYVEPIPNLPTLAPTNIYTEDTQPIRDQLDKIYTDVSNVVNDKSRANRYLDIEDITNDVWTDPDPQADPNPIFTKTISTSKITAPVAGVLTAGAINTLPHGIIDFDYLVNARVCVSDGTTGRVIPFSSPTAAKSASVEVNSTNIFIEIGAAFGAGYSGSAILEYTKLKA